MYDRSNTESNSAFARGRSSGQLELEANRESYAKTPQAQKLEQGRSFGSGFHDDSLVEAGCSNDEEKLHLASKSYTSSTL